MIKPRDVTGYSKYLSDMYRINARVGEVDGRKTAITKMTYCEYEDARYVHVEFEDGTSEDVFNPDVVTYAAPKPEGEWATVTDQEMQKEIQRRNGAYTIPPRRQ